MYYYSRAILLSAAVVLAVSGGVHAQDNTEGVHHRPTATDLLPGLANYLAGAWIESTPAIDRESGDRLFHLGNTATEQDFYLIGGSGGPGALGGNISSVAVGAGYRQPLNDAVSWHLDLRNHVLQRDYFGDRDAASNFELSLGMQLSF